MSKKSRLRALKAKQLEEKRIYEREEQLLAERARSGEESRMPKRYRKAGSAEKAGKKSRRKEHWIYSAIKLVMLIPYAVNGLFFGLITVIAVTVVGLHGIGNSMAYAILAADALMTFGLVFAFLRKYILSFVFSASGSGLFFGVGVKFVSKIQYYMENYAVPEENKNMDIKYMLYFYPILLVALCSTVLLVMTAAGRILAKKREKERFNNMPVKSIID